MSSWRLGLIGGTGLYDLSLTDERWEAVSTHWGKPSDELRLGKLEDIEVVFLPRHRRGHQLSPSQINYRANIAALKAIGVTDIISLSACGSFREDFAPGDFVFIDQFIDRTIFRKKSFFDQGCVCHVPFADPISARLADFLEQSSKLEGLDYHRGGTYLAMEGPQFSTRAESELYRSWGCDVIGMTNMPEAKLAREAELPYATVAMVTDYDSWHEPLELAQIFEVLGNNVEKVQKLLRRFVRRLPQERKADPQGIETILDHAIITARADRSADYITRYAPIITRFAQAEQQA